MNEITYAFDQLLTQLAVIGLRVKVSKCKFWSPSRILLSIEILQRCTLVTDGLHILGVLMDSQDFVTHFLDETLSQNVVHIDDFPFLGNAKVALSILSSCITRQPFYLTHTILHFSSFLFFLVCFNRKNM
jgi:hypothetical protein